MIRTTKCGVVEKFPEREWQHPIHARGVRSQSLPVTLGPLSDARIDYYASQGWYAGRSLRYKPVLPL